MQCEYGVWWMSCERSGCAREDTMGYDADERIIRYAVGEIFVMQQHVCIGVPLPFLCKLHATLSRLDFPEVKACCFHFWAHSDNERVGLIGKRFNSYFAFFFRSFKPKCHWRQFRSLCILNAGFQSQYQRFSPQSERCRANIVAKSFHTLFKYYWVFICFAQCDNTTAYIFCLLLLLLLSLSTKLFGCTCFSV